MTWTPLCSVNKKNCIRLRHESRIACTGRHQSCVKDNSTSKRESPTTRASDPVFGTVRQQHHATVAPSSFPSTPDYYPSYGFPSRGNGRRPVPSSIRLSLSA